LVSGLVDILVLKIDWLVVWCVGVVVSVRDTRYCNVRANTCVMVNFDLYMSIQNEQKKPFLQPTRKF